MSFRTCLVKTFNSISVPTLLSDKDGNVLYINSAFTDITGYESDEVLNKKIGKRENILYSGYHSDAFYKKMWDTIMNGDVYVSEVRNKRKDGTLYWEQITIQPIKDESDGQTYFVANLQDITNERQTKLKLEAILESISKEFIITVHNLDKKIVEVIGEDYNTFLPIRLTRFLGKSFDEIQLLDSSNLDELNEAFNSIEKNPNKSYIKELTVQCGANKITLECTVRRFNSVGYLMIFRDVTSYINTLKTKIGLTGLEEQINKLIKSRIELKDNL